MFAANEGDKPALGERGAEGVPILGSGSRDGSDTDARSLGGPIGV